LWLVAVGVGFLLQGSLGPQAAYAGHTTPGAWAEHQDIITCIHCHKQIIVAGNPDGSNREIAASPSITASTRSTHGKRSGWESTVSAMTSKVGLGTANAATISNYLNAYYCGTTCSPPYYSISATPGSSAATVTYETGYASSNGQSCYGTTTASMPRCASETGAGTSHSINLTGLTSSTTYYYKILFTDSTGRSFDTSVDGAESFTTSVQTDTTPPIPPTQGMGR
jgi:hypothetical protein